MIFPFYLSLFLLEAKVYNRTSNIFKRRLPYLNHHLWYLLSLIGGQQYFGGLRDQMVLLRAT